MFGIFAKIKFLFLLLLIALLLFAVALVWFALAHPTTAELLFSVLTGKVGVDPLSLLREQGEGLLEMARDKLPW